MTPGGREGAVCVCMCVWVGVIVAPNDRREGE